MNKNMWGEALYTATYLLNRLPTETLKVTPYEMLERKRPKMNNLQIFGSVAFAKILGPLKKLDKRSKKLRFVGYAPLEYRLWDENKKNIILARDVKFETEETMKYKEERLKRRFLFEDAEDKQVESEENNQNEQEEKNEESSDEVESDEDFQSEDGEKDKKEDKVIKENDETDIRKSGRNKRTPAKFNDYELGKFKDYVYLTYSEATNGTDKEK